MTRDSSPQTLGQLLRMHRTAHGLTQLALAEQSGCSSEMLRKYEADAKRPSRQVIERLAAALRLEIGERERLLGFLPVDERWAPAAPATSEPPWFPRTKLHAPLVRGDTLARPRLADPLGRALGSARLVLLSAPAGTGKSTLLASLYMAHAAARGRAAWVTLDEDDNDLVRFLAVLGDACEGLAPGAAAAIRPLMSGLAPDQGDRTTRVRHVLSALVNALLDATQAPALLVLDNLHTLTEPGLFAALDFLIDQLPGHVTLAIATRHDPPLPLTRLRARRELLELRLPDLRFTAAESVDLLNGTLQLGLEHSLVDALHNRTEGWAAGLCLLAARLEQLPEQAGRMRLLAGLAQSDRYLFEYLADEVLNREPPPVRAFLMETAVLSELTATTCRALTGRDDADGLLDDLYRRNLFLVALEDDWHASGNVLSDEPSGIARDEAIYRYHDLFRDFLQARLRREAPERWQALHLQAIDAEPDPLRQAQHAIAAEAWSALAALIEQYGGDLLGRGMPKVVETWAAVLPRHVLALHPRIRYLWATIAMARRDLDTGRALLTEALATIDPTSEPALRGAALAALASCCSMLADFPAASAAADAALALPLDTSERVQLLAVRAHLAMGRGEWQQTTADLDAALDLAEALSDHQVAAALAAAFFAAYGVLPPGGQARVRRLCQLLDRLATPHHLPLRAASAQYRAWLHVWQGDWAAARVLGEQALALSEQAGHLFWVDIEAGAMLPVLYALERDDAAAEAAFAQLRQTIAQPEVASSMRSWAALYMSLEARARWLRGETEAARQLYTDMCAAQNAHEWPGLGAVRAYIAALLAFADGRLDAAIHAAAEAINLAQRYPFVMLYGDPNIPYAAARLRNRQADEALAIFAPILTRHASEDTLGRLRWEGAPLLVPLLRLAFERDYQADAASQLLATLGVAPPMLDPATGVLVPATGEILSPREVEVLRLLAQGARNAAIAERLIISPHTVKHHVSSVLAKLGAATRTEASRLAHELGVVES